MIWLVMAWAGSRPFASETPAAATLAGFAIAFVILRRWARRSPALAGPAGVSLGAPPASHPGRTTEDDLEALRAKAEAELRRLRG